MDRADAAVSWDADFAGLPPIELPDGRKLETLADCRALHPGFAGARAGSLGGAVAGS